MINSIACVCENIHKTLQLTIQGQRGTYDSDGVSIDDIEVSNTAAVDENTSKYLYLEKPLTVKHAHFNENSVIVFILYMKKLY